MIYLSNPFVDVVHVERLITVYYFTYDKSYRSSGESHDFWEINYADHGSINVSCDGVNHLLNTGDLILLPPGKHHDLRADGQKQSSAFIFSFKAHSELLEKLGCIVHRISQPLKDKLAGLSDIFNRTYALPMKYNEIEWLELRPDAPIGSEQMVRTMLEQFLILLIQDVLASRNSDKPLVVTSKSQFDDCIAEQIMNLLKKNICQSLTLNEITHTLGYGKTYLCSVFKKVYGTSIMSYYIQLKIDEAQRLLHEGTMTISEISEKLSFSTPQYFSKRFSETVGMSPREFMASTQKNWSHVKKS